MNFNVVTYVIIQAPAVEIVSSISGAVESQSVENTATSTPPIDSSTPPSEQQASAAPQAVQPDSSVDYEVSLSTYTV